MPSASNGLGRRSGAGELRARLGAALACLGAAALVPAGCADDVPPLEVVRDDPSDNPLRGLSDEEMARFDLGDALFEMRFLESQGLGPLYIRQACASCHAGDARGPGAVTKMVPGDGATPLPYGQTARPQLAAGAITGITPPPGARTSLRVGPAVFARGYLEAITDAEIERVEREQTAPGSPVSGRINRVAYQAELNPDARFHGFRPGDQNLIGRFGLKARLATVDEFSADAFQGDMGITSPLRPTELPNPDGLGDDHRPGVDVTLDDVNTVADYVRTLAIPRRAEPNAADRGLFASAGCGACHVPALRTRADYPVAALAGIDAPVYTDLLLHDMGVDLADGLPEGSASGSEWRTAPLIGLRFFRSYLHDGRAKTLRQAIELHAGSGSEANVSVAAFMALTAADQERLIAFVGGL